MSHHGNMFAKREEHRTRKVVDKAGGTAQNMLGVEVCTLAAGQDQRAGGDGRVLVGQSEVVSLSMLMEMQLELRSLQEKVDYLIRLKSFKREAMPSLGAS